MFVKYLHSKFVNAQLAKITIFSVTDIKFKKPSTVCKPITSRVTKFSFLVFRDNLRRKRVIHFITQ